MRIRAPEGMQQGNINTWQTLRRAVGVSTQLQASDPPKKHMVLNVLRIIDICRGLAREGWNNTRLADSQIEGGTSIPLN